MTSFEHTSTTSTTTNRQFRPKSGDMVLYGGRAYYYQPNGNTCFLSSRKEDLHKTFRAVFIPRITAITPAPQEVTFQREPVRLWPQVQMWK